MLTGSELSGEVDVALLEAELCHSLELLAVKGRLAVVRGICDLDIDAAALVEPLQVPGRVLAEARIAK